MTEISQYLQIDFVNFILLTNFYKIHTYVNWPLFCKQKLNIINCIIIELFFKKIMDTPNFLKIEKKYNEDGTPKKDAITILSKK